jgi:hypothetical protein
MKRSDLSIFAFIPFLCFGIAEAIVVVIVVVVVVVVVVVIVVVVVVVVILEWPRIATRLYSL